MAAPGGGRGARRAAAAERGGVGRPVRRQHVFGVPRPRAGVGVLACACEVRARASCAGPRWADAVAAAARRRGLPKPRPDVGLHAARVGPVPPMSVRGVRLQERSGVPVLPHMQRGRQEAARQGAGALLLAQPPEGHGGEGACAQIEARPELRPSWLARGLTAQAAVRAPGALLSDRPGSFLCPPLWRSPAPRGQSVPPSG